MTLDTVTEEGHVRPSLPVGTRGHVLRMPYGTMPVHDVSLANT